MVQEPSCDTKWLAATQDTAAEGAQQSGLDRQCFLTQLANALTTLNGLVYLTHQAAYHAERQRYVEAMQNTVGQIAQSMQQYRLTPGDHP